MILNDEEPTFDEQYAEIAEMFQEFDDNNDYLYCYVENYFANCNKFDAYTKAMDYLDGFSKDPAYTTHLRISELISLERTWFDLTKVVEPNQLFIFSTPLNYLGFKLTYLLENLDSLSEFKITPITLKEHKCEYLYYNLRENTNDDIYGYCLLEHENTALLYE